MIEEKQAEALELALGVIREAREYLDDWAHDFVHKYPAQGCHTCLHIYNLERILGVPVSPPPAPTPGKD